MKRTNVGFWIFGIALVIGTGWLWCGKKHADVTSITPQPEIWEILRSGVVGEGIEQQRLEVVLREQASSLELPYTFWSGTGTDIRISPSRQSVAVWPVGENAWSLEVSCGNCAEFQVELEQIGAKVLSRGYGTIYRL